MSDGRPPLIVLDANRREDLEGAAAALAADGWVVHDGLQGLPLRVERLVCRALVVDAADAAAAVLAASWGAGVLLGIGAVGPELRDPLLDDLARIGPVLRRVSEAAPGLHPESARLLDLLAEGRSLGAAAAEAFISRRTADRRLADARRQLGAQTTAEAISRWRARLAGRG